MPSTSPTPDAIETCCCIVGGGPAGMMLGYLLARAGVHVVVLEKHADFLRDFRGDTIHPSTMEVMYELGILDDFLKRPHTELTRISGRIGDHRVVMGDFSHSPTHCKFIALMPQWDFLNFIAEQAGRYSTFRLEMQAEAFDLIEQDGKVAGVKVRTPRGEMEIRADLVVAADGRHSTLRERAGMKVLDIGAPMDVLWMRLSQKPDDPRDTLGRVNRGRVLVTLDRGDYWQCAFVIPKGKAEEIRGEGLAAFRERIAEIAPFLRDRVEELQDWDQIKLLSVAVDRLEQWYRPGLLCIGDAAHAMSPIGGVGINLAIQDAVAAANILAAPLLQVDASEEVLSKVQERRTFPTRATQAVQVFIQNRVIGPVLQRGAPIGSLPWPVKMLQWFPVLQRIPARLIGVGFRPEHVHAKLGFSDIPPDILK
jgi:2-polyprenyl-6-methoxyphenol hydroxylase-like FAD-dependent oxidoreductase